MPTLRSSLVLAAVLAGVPASATTVPVDPYGTVTIAPASTSILVGVVNLDMGVFSRKAGVYTSGYSATVFPYFFWSEAGRLSIRVTNDVLRQLARGQPVDFIGQAVRDDGSLRQITGRATPTDPRGGNIKVRVYVTKHIVLTFNTTYRFAPAR